METKICRECGRELPLSDFYAHKKMADGHLNKCKACVTSRVATHREANLTRIQAYDRKRHRTDEHRAAVREYHRRQRKEVAKYKKAWAERNADKRAAQVALGNAVRDGRVIKKPCVMCGSEKSEGHHSDYSKPLIVTWLCRRCHGKLHWKD